MKNVEHQKLEHVLLMYLLSRLSCLKGHSPFETAHKTKQIFVEIPVFIRSLSTCFFNEIVQEDSQMLYDALSILGCSEKKK